MRNNYFFVDGSALLGDIHRTRTSLSLAQAARLDLTSFAAFFVSERFSEYHRGSWRRFVFYFVQDNERLRNSVDLPNFTIPGAVSDLRVEFCGRRIPELERAAEWLTDHKAPPYVRDRLHRSEKAVDTQICCDALQLAATGKLDRLFLYANDFDYVPLCRAMRTLGCNINLFQMRGEFVNRDLVEECDAFHAMDEESLKEAFVVPKNEAGPEGAKT